METVVFVHGLWMVGVDMTLLRRRVGRFDFKTHQFTYPTVRRSVTDNAHHLNDVVSEIDASVIHFVGHSLGGLVIRMLFHLFPDQKPGRIVTLGTPHQGSQFGRYLGQHLFGRLILGRSLRPDGISGEALPPWEGQREFGVIAGSHHVGTGLMMPGLRGKKGDGVITLEEAHLPGETDFIQIYSVHTQLLFSRTAARQTAMFLKNGHFSPAAHIGSMGVMR